MKTFLSILIGLATGGLICGEAYAWAREGHQVVALIAQRLVSPATQAKIRELLIDGDDNDLVSIACWADELVWAARGEGPLVQNKEALDFNDRFPSNRAWHFVNLPLGTMSYEKASKFTPSDNIVQAISRCIQILESPVRDPKEFSKVQALRLLIHFLADIHQPLHCGTGYYSFDRFGAVHLISFPAEAVGKPNDRGGNLLFYGELPTEQLHALWDSVIVDKVDESADFKALALSLLQRYRASKMTTTTGDYHGWAEAWAIDSVRIAALAYLGICFEKAEFGPDKNLSRIEVTLPTNYWQANKVYAAEQLMRAGVRLAQLLDSIRWQSFAEH